MRMTVGATARQVPQGGQLLLGDGTEAERGLRAWLEAAGVSVAQSGWARTGAHFAP